MEHISFIGMKRHNEKSRYGIKSISAFSIFCIEAQILFFFTAQ